MTFWLQRRGSLSTVALRKQSVVVIDLTIRQKLPPSIGPDPPIQYVAIKNTNGAVFTERSHLITLDRKSVELVLLVVDGLRDGLILGWRFGEAVGTVDALRVLEAIVGCAF